jgi:predicted Zn finger-like uncharacterized protein
MRLVCPNCDAQYEVDDAAIPLAGRDVQCSNCGHAWFQRPLEVEAEEELDDEIFLSDDEARLAEPAAPQATAEAGPGPADAAIQPLPPPSHAPGKPTEPIVAEPAAYDPDEFEEDEAPPPPVADDAPARKPALDDALMAVLREEAEREAAVRRAEAPKAIETQTEMGLRPAAPVSPSVLAARERFADLSVDREDVVEDDEEIVTRPASRRELLPDIEEINSTLRASSEPRGDDEETFLPPPEPLTDGRSGFRSGFLLMVLLAAGLWLAYVMAPRIVAQIPASAPAMGAYVQAVDKARVGVDAALQSASRSLRDLSGQDG